MEGKDVVAVARRDGNVGIVAVVVAVAVVVGQDTLERRGGKKGRGGIYSTRRVRKTSRMTIDQPRL